jgi:hypothetical protein
VTIDDQRATRQFTFRHLRQTNNTKANNIVYNHNTHAATQTGGCTNTRVRMLNTDGYPRSDASTPALARTNTRARTGTHAHTHMHKQTHRRTHRHAHTDAYRRTDTHTHRHTRPCIPATHPLTNPLPPNTHTQAHTGTRTPARTNRHAHTHTHTRTHALAHSFNPRTHSQTQFHPTVVKGVSAAKTIK